MSSSEIREKLKNDFEYLEIEDDYLLHSVFEKSIDKATIHLVCKNLLIIKTGSVFYRDLLIVMKLHGLLSSKLMKFNPESNTMTVNIDIVTINIMSKR